MVNEIIKERMMKQLRKTINEYWSITDNPFEAIRDLYIRSKDNIEVCIPTDYVDFDLCEDIHNKIDALYSSIILQIKGEPDIRLYIQIDTCNYTTVLIVFENQVVYKTATKSWKVLWRSEEALKDFMDNTLSCIIENIELMPTNEELEFIMNNRMETGMSGRGLETDGHHPYMMMRY
jgi:hypothetical protein